MNHQFIAYTDGACRGNPGHSSCSWICYCDGIEIASNGEYLGIKTNNHAEYMGMLRLLQWMEQNKNYAVTEIYCDSILVVNQVNGLWKVKDKNLYPIWTSVMLLLNKTNTRVKHCRGHQGVAGNERADQLCNEILDGRGQ